MLPIVGGGPARDLIPEANCVLASDARGEARPDVKNQMCDIGAYEFTILSCAEDAQRRYDQGELFVKSCTPELEDFELTLGSASYWLLAMLGLLGFTRRQYLKNK
jgi:hypothetical protein